MNRHFPDNMPSFYKNRFCGRKTEESLSVSVTVSLEEEGRERERKRKKSGLHVKFPHYIGETSFCTLCSRQGRQKESLKRVLGSHPMPYYTCQAARLDKAGLGLDKRTKEHSLSSKYRNFTCFVYTRILSCSLFHRSLLEFYIICHVCVRRRIRSQVNTQLGQQLRSFQLLCNILTRLLTLHDLYLFSCVTDFFLVHRVICTTVASRVPLFSVSKKKFRRKTNDSR